MTKFVRKWNCAVCNKQLIYDDEKHTLTCGCGSFHCEFVNTQEFIPLPKYDRKYWKSEKFPVDCAKFLSTEVLLDGSSVIFISDRNSIIAKGEDPHLTLRWIHYPKDNKTQLCMAIDGSFHTEKIGYNQVDPNAWKERIWIFLSPEVLPKITQFLERNPHVIASWM
jgi:hypothetical protein